MYTCMYVCMHISHINVFYQYRNFEIRHVPAWFLEVTSICEVYMSVDVSALQGINN